MRMSGLAEATGVPVATLKYYLREGLLHAGRATSRTQAEYDNSHVERVRLVRALTEVGGLSLATVGRVLAVIEEPNLERTEVLGAAQRSLLGVDRVAIPPRDVEEPWAQSRTHAWLAGRGWLVDPRDPVVEDLDRAWSACDAAGIGLDEARMDAYADAAEQIAVIDVDSVPPEPQAAVRQVVLGTVLVDPVLAALRRLAQQHTAVSREVSAQG
ncbi:DNA-binding transcriptional MerR regulator [Kineosphaera limosa]|uniref:Putative MerR family transcriptional regulator n=1 Tax=Kineosphaera limosa NBRC 100340 TaxID=1184609 RepID=K6XF11_9MICO|nr:MerR family transcriptional regulator [Kineosphaera limosa]NYE00665.1 DNA-binding transcriptional MerR regulator [Kineosphaera limosa]GAB97399.1 putative MerR family transcriptional regulator [Kineosphaera limosa NBRC 100340]